MRNGGNYQGTILSLCELFCFNYQLEKELIENARATMRANGKNARNTNAVDLQRMMMVAPVAAVEETKIEDG